MTMASKVGFVGRAGAAASSPGKPVHLRRFVFRRIADRDARDEHALAGWDDDGGANEGGSSATIR
jgi:hypothetical protein